jgi:hypothetical protein
MPSELRYDYLGRLRRPWLRVIVAYRPVGSLGGGSIPTRDDRLSGEWRNAFSRGGSMLFTSDILVVPARMTVDQGGPGLKNACGAQDLKHS